MEEALPPELCGNRMRVKELNQIAKDMRKDILQMGYNCGTMGAHIGGSMSVVEIMAVLYSDIMRHDGEERDRFIMSKAHSVMALYAALHQIGKITDEEILAGMKQGSFLYKHPRMNLTKGIEFSGGSLGQGLSLGVGTAMALKRKGNDTSKVYVVVGDGECNEGAIWEAASSASHYCLDNLIVIVDLNGLQNDGTTEDVLNFSDMQKKWEAFGFEAQMVDGHDVAQLKDALSVVSKKPRVIIAKTVKGKGVSFAENVVDWHAAYLTKELYEQAMEELMND